MFLNDLLLVIFCEGTEVFLIYFAKIHWPHNDQEKDIKSNQMKKSFSLNQDPAETNASSVKPLGLYERSWGPVWLPGHTSVTPVLKDKHRLSADDAPTASSNKNN